MTDYLTPLRGPARLLVALALLAAATACGGARNAGPPPGIAPDEFLHTRGMTAMMERKWLDARQYFQQIVDNYPQSTRRPDAKLGLGDSYLGEGTTEALIFAANEFREFLQFYPIHSRADYAQYKLAMSHYEQMRAPERDQTETREALRQFDVFFERYPASALTTEVRQKWRDARNRLSQASLSIGVFYYRSRWYPGAVERFKEILKDDPGFTGRDTLYFYLAESLVRTDKKAEALPYLDRLVMEFGQSEHFEDARKRLQELKAQ